MNMTSVTGTINPWTSKIQLEEKPSPGYARNVMLLIKVARIDMPTAQDGTLPLAVKNFFRLFWFLENLRLTAIGIISDPAMMI
jgi:hypothetical protein